MKPAAVCETRPEAFISDTLLILLLVILAIAWPLLVGPQLVIMWRMKHNAERAQTRITANDLIPGAVDA